MADVAECDEGGLWRTKLNKWVDVWSSKDEDGTQGTGAGRVDTKDARHIHASHDPHGTQINDRRLVW